MILVDSSVWIDYFNGKKTAQTDWLDSSLGNIPLMMGDLILTEVLQGFLHDKDFKVAKDLLLGIPFMSMGGRALALESAMNYRFLRFEVAWLERDDRIVLPYNRLEWFRKVLDGSGIHLLPLTPNIASIAVDLPEHHSDVNLFKSE